MIYFDLLIKEFINLRKSIGVVIVLFLVPIFLIAVMGFAFQDNETVYQIGFVNLDDPNSDLNDGILTSLKNVSAFEVIEYETEEEAINNVKNSSISGCLVLPKGFDKSHEDGEADAKLIVDNSHNVSSSVIEGIIGRFFEQFNTRIMSVFAAEMVYQELEMGDDPNEAIEIAKDYVIHVERSPIEIVKEYIAPISNENSMSGFNQTTCGMTAMFILFLCILWGSSNIIDEKITGTMSRLVLSPIHIGTILAAKLTYIGILSFFQFLIFFGIGHYVFDVPVGNVTTLIILNIVFIMQASSLGLLVSIIAKTRISAIGFSFFVIMLLSPLGGLWFPLEIIPKVMQTIASFLPTGAFMLAIENTILKGASLVSISHQLLVIVVYFILTFGISLKIGVLGKASA